MDYTHYKITDLGERAITKIDGALAVLNTWYPESSVLTIEKENSTDLGEPYDYIRYKAKNALLESNEGTITINFPPDKTNPPSSSDKTVSANDNEELIFDPIINNADRIKIVSYDQGIGSVEFNNFPILFNTEIMLYDLNKIKIKTLTGKGEPFLNIVFQVGNNQQYSQPYNYTINKTGLASLTTPEESQRTEDQINYLESVFEIIDGYVNKNAQLEVIVDLSASAFPANTDNELIINYGFQEVVINSNGTTNLNVDLGTNGSSIITNEISINQNDSPVTGTITFNLLSIDNDTNLVSNQNQNIITLNL